MSAPGHVHQQKPESAITQLQGDYNLVAAWFVGVMTGFKGHNALQVDYKPRGTHYSTTRSSLRTLISQLPAARHVFVEHVHRRLKESPPLFTPPSELFNVAKPQYAEFMALTRCIFSSKLAIESLPYLIHLVKGIPDAEVYWKPNDDLENSLERACGDIVQAVQALKESLGTSYPEKQELLQARAYLSDLSNAISACDEYCSSRGLSCPFGRAQLQVQDFLATLEPTVRARRASIFTQLDISIDTASSTSVEQTRLGSLTVPRLFNGLWQMSSPAWGCSSSRKQTAALAQLIQCGLLATDMADHYGDAELIYGGFRRCMKPEVRERIIAASKWCVFRPLNGPITSRTVLDAVQERAGRLKGRIDLLQYNDKGYLPVLVELVKLTKSHPSLVSNIGLCNFDAEHTEEVCEHLLSELGEVGVVSNQIQCGGFLSQKWLGVDPPDIYSESAGLTPSQRKYFDVISTWGTWADLQELLKTLTTIAEKHKVDCSNVAARWVLDNPAVGAVIVGTRLGVSSNVYSNLKVFSFQLDAEDLQQIEAAALGERARKVFEMMGDCGSEYRSK
ncbi:aldo keto reductase [Moniliophthora roreri]|nr:aldo keto reductase [Moniliophthora roreri]